MKEEQNVFNRIHELLRKDEGIKGASQAVEQLSWMLLLKKIDDITQRYVFEGVAKNFPIIKEMLWSSWGDHFDNKDTNDKSNLLDFVKFQVIPYYANLDKNSHYGKLNEFLRHTAIVFKHISCRIVSYDTFNLVRHELNRINLSFDNVAQDYEELIYSMVGNAGKTGEYYTPRILASVILKVLSPSKFYRFYDPTLGTGGFLVEAYKKFEQSEEYHDLNHSPCFMGVEINPTAYLIGLLNIVLNDVYSFKLSFGNALEKGLKKDIMYDLIISNPPFGLADKKSIIFDDINKPSQIEALFLEHIMDKLETGGQAAIIVPEHILHNTSYSIIKLRQRLIEQFNLKTVLCLPAGAMAPYSSVKLCVLFFENTHPTEKYWIYNFNTTERFTKKNKITLHHFDDFLESVTSKVESNNFQLIQRDLLNSDYDLSFTSPLELVIPRVSSRQLLYDFNNKLTEAISQLNEIETLANDIEKLAFESECLSEKVIIKDVLKFSSGKSLRKKDMSPTGNIPVYGGNGIVGYHNKSNLGGNNILIGRVGAICGNVHYVEGKIWITNNALRVVLNNEIEVNLQYLARVLEALDLRKYARGTAQVFITYAKIEALSFKLPPLNIQIELVNKFNQLDKIIDNTFESNKLQAKNLDMLRDNMRSMLSYQCENVH